MTARMVEHGKVLWWFFLATLITHGLLFFYNTQIWDGVSVVQTMHQPDRWKALKDFLVVGLPLTGLIHVLLGWFQSYLAYQIASFLSLMLSAWLVWHIALLMRLPRPYAWLLALLTLAVPGCTLDGNFIMVPQYVELTCFFLAAYCMLRAEGSNLGAQCLLSVVAIALYLVAFSIGSLSCLYLIAFILLYIHHTRLRGECVYRLSTLCFFCLRRLHFLLLPFVSWVLVHRLFPIGGSYLLARYNTLRPLTVVFSAFSLLEVKRLIIEYVFPFFCVVAVSIFCNILFNKNRTVRFDKRLCRQGAVVACLGLLACVLAIVPYMLVMKHYGVGQFSSRYLLLWPVSVSLLFVGVVFLLASCYSRRAHSTFIWIVSVLLLMTLAASNLYRQLSQLGQIAYRQSLSEAMHASVGSAQYDAFIVKTNPVASVDYNALFPNEWEHLYLVAHPSTKKPVAFILSGWARAGFKPIKQGTYAYLSSINHYLFFWGDTTGRYWRGADMQGRYAILMPVVTRPIKPAGVLGMQYVWTCQVLKRQPCNLFDIQFKLLPLPPGEIEIYPPYF